MSDVLQHAGFPSNTAAAVGARVTASKPYSGAKRNSKGQNRRQMSPVLAQMLHRLYQPFNERMYVAVKAHSLKVSPCHSSFRFLDAEVATWNATEEQLTCRTSFQPFESTHSRGVRPSPWIRSRHASPGHKTAMRLFSTGSKSASSTDTQVQQQDINEQQDINQHLLASMVSSRAAIRLTTDKWRAIVQKPAAFKSQSPQKWAQAHFDHFLLQ